MVGNETVQVESEKPFKVLLASFGKTERRLLIGQRIASANFYPTLIDELNTMHDTLLCIMNERKNNMYLKRLFDLKDANVISYYTRSARNSNTGADNKPISADDLELSDIDKRHHLDIRNKLKEHDYTWSGKLEVDITKHQINLLEAVQCFKSHAYRAGPNTRKLE